MMEYDDRHRDHGDDERPPGEVGPHRCRRVAPGQRSTRVMRTPFKEWYNTAPKRIFR